MGDITLDSLIYDLLEGIDLIHRGARKPVDASLTYYLQCASDAMQGCDLHLQLTPKTPLRWMVTAWHESEDGKRLHDLAFLHHTPQEALLGVLQHYRKSGGWPHMQSSTTLGPDK